MRLYFVMNSSSVKGYKGPGCSLQTRQAHETAEKGELDPEIDL